MIYCFSKARLTSSLALLITLITCLNTSILSNAAIKPVLKDFNRAVATPHTSVVFVISGLVAQQDKLCATLASILQQDYHDWHAACSLSIAPYFVDNYNNSIEEVRLTFLSKLEQMAGFSSKKLQEKIKLTVGDEHTCSLYKLWSAYGGDTIMVHLQPGDIFAHDHALATLTQAHKTSDVLLTYGHYLKSDLKSNQVSGYKIDRTWAADKLRLQLFGKGTPGYPFAFKAKLFNFIRIEDLFYGSTFFAHTTPEAYWYPLLELSQNDSLFIEEPLVICSPQEVRSRKDNVSLQQIIRAKPYQALETSDTNIASIINNGISDTTLRAHAQNTQVTVLAYSKDRPLQLYAFLESLTKHISGSYSVSVIYYATDDSYHKAYQEVAQAYHHVKFIAQRGSPYDFKTLTLKELYEHSQAEYVLFAVDDLIVRTPVTLGTCVYFLEKTNATSFHLRLGKNITYNYMRNKEAEQPPLYEIGEGVLLWKSNGSSGGWHYPYSLDMSLYRKKDIKRALESLAYQTPNKLEEQWAFSVKHSHINLCPKESATTNVPLNVVQNDCPDNRHMNLYSPKQLLEFFNKKLKIDIEAWYKLRPKAPHVPLTPSFTTRAIK